MRNHESFSNQNFVTEVIKFLKDENLFLCNGSGKIFVTIALKVLYVGRKLVRVYSFCK